MPFSTLEARFERYAGREKVDSACGASLTPKDASELERGCGCTVVARAELHVYAAGAVSVHMPMLGDREAHAVHTSCSRGTHEVSTSPSELSLMHSWPWEFCPRFARGP